eukprot:3456073-Karenia_brevis.AAC.1
MTLGSDVHVNTGSSAVHTHDHMTRGSDTRTTTRSAAAAQTDDPLDQAHAGRGQASDNHRKLIQTGAIQPY